MASFLDYVKKQVDFGNVRLDPASISDEYTLSVSDGSTSSITGAVAHLRDDATKFKYTSYGMKLVNGYYEGNINGVQTITEFMTDAPVFEFRTRNQGGMYTVEIDGKIVNPDGLILTKDNVVRIVKVEIKTGVERKMRHWKIYSVITSYAAFWTGPSDTVTSNITLKGRGFIYQLGDSYTYGTGGGYPGYGYGSSPAINDFYHFREGLNLNGIAEGIGGSAWLSSEEGRFPINRVKARLAMLQGAKPDFVSLALGLNDASIPGIISDNPANGSQLQDKMYECINEVRISQPQANMIAIGCATPVGAVPATDVVQRLVQEVCANEGIEFIDMRNVITQANGWDLYTSNIQGSLPDRNHPTPIGHRIRGMHMIKASINAAIEGRSLVPKRLAKGFVVTYIKRLNFAVDVIKETVQAMDSNDAYWKVKSREYNNPNLRIEIISVE